MEAQVPPQQGTHSLTAELLAQRDPDSPWPILALLLRARVGRLFLRVPQVPFFWYLGLGVGFFSLRVPYVSLFRNRLLFQ